MVYESLMGRLWSSVCLVSLWRSGFGKLVGSVNVGEMMEWSVGEFGIN